MSGSVPNPYPGLRAFRTEEDYLFFGREEQTGDLLELLGANRFLAVVGTSGSGKSSLVRAGLVPALVKGTLDSGSARWDIAVLRPAGDPLRSLAAALCESGLYDGEDAESVPRVIATLGRSTRGLIEAYRQSDRAESSRLLLVVDQFEELFRYDHGDAAARDATRAFVALLLEAVQQTELPIYIALTMRSDYIGDCARVPGLAEAVNAGEYLVPRLGREQIRRAIQGPAKVGGSSVAKRLVQRLLADLGDDADQLPVLQHALMRMWDARGDDRELDIDDYDAIGGLSKALCRHADEVWDGLATDRLRRTAERVFKTLTERTGGERGVRRPTRVTRLEAICRGERGELEAVLDAYRAPGVSFLMPGETVDLAGNPMIDISHESLMRVWARLRDWVDEEARSAATYRRLAETAALWRDGRAGLYRQPELGVAQAWRHESEPNPSWGSLYAPGYENAIAFLDASQHAADAEELEREKARQRELEQTRELADTQARSARMFRRFTIGVAVLALAAIVLAVQAFRLRGEAERSRELAVDSAQQAEVEAQRALEAEASARHEQGIAWLERAQAMVEEKRFLAAKLLAARTIGFDGYGREGVEPLDAESTRPLLRPGSGAASLARRLIDTLPDHAPTFRSGVAASTGRTYAVCFSPGGDRAAVGNDAGVIEVRDVRTGARLQRFRAHARRVSFLDMTPDGKSVVSASRESATFRRHDIESGGEIWGLEHRSMFRMGALSPDGRTAVATDLSGAIVRVEVETGRLLPPFESPSMALGVAFHPTEPLLASGHSSGELRLWDLESGELIGSTQAHRASIYSVRFDAGGRSLLTCGAVDDDEPAGVKVWTPGDGEAYRLARDWTGFSRSGFESRRSLGLYWCEVRPQGDFAVVSSSDGRLHLRSFPDGAELGVLDGHAAGVRQFDISADGTRLISGSADGSLRLWDLETRREISAYTSEDVELARGVDLSPDGLRLATSTLDGEVRLRDVISGELVQRRSGLGNLELLHYSPDGRFIAVAGPDVVQVLDAETLENVRQLWSGWVGSSCWSPDGRFLAARTGDGFKLWDVDDFEEAASWDASSADALAFHPDGRVLALSSSRGTTFWSVDSGEQLAEWPGVGSSSEIAYHPDGGLLALAGSSGIVTLWATGGAPVASGEVRTPNGGSVRRIAFSPDGRLLAASVWPSPLETDLDPAASEIPVWDVVSRRLLVRLEGHSQPIHEIAFSPDSRSLASTSIDNTVRIWSIDRSLDRESIPLGEIDHRETEFIDDQTLATLGGQGIHIVDRRSGAVLRRLTSRVYAGAHVTASPGGRYLAAGGQRSAAVWNLETGEELAVFENSSVVFTRSAFSDDERWLAVSRGTWLDRFDLETGVRSSWPRPANTLDLDVDGTGRVWTAGDDGIVRVVDLENEEELLEFRGSETGIRRLVLAPAGDALATCDEVGVVRVWNLADRTLRHELSASFSQWCELAFAPDGERLATLADGELRLWSAVTGDEIRTYSSEGLEKGFRPWSLDFSPSGELIALDGSGSTIALCLTDPPERPAARLVDWATDLRLEGRRVVPAAGNLVDARAVLWRPAPSRAVSLGLTQERPAEDRDDALVAHLISAGNLEAALVVWRRLPEALQAPRAPELLEALRRRAERVARSGAIDLALRLADFAIEVAAQAGPDAPFDAACTRAKILAGSDRLDEALRVWSTSIEAATSAGRVAAAERLAESRWRVFLSRGDHAVAGDQLAELLALPGYSDAARRARTIRKHLDAVAERLAEGVSGDDLTDRRLAAALAGIAVASKVESSIDLSSIDALTSLVGAARQGREPVTLLAENAEWKVRDPAQGAPPEAWRSRGFDAASWLTAAGPISFGPTETSPALRSPALVRFLRTTFRVDRGPLPDDYGLSVRHFSRLASAVFLNGHEIARQGLHPGEAGAETAAPRQTLGSSVELENAALAEPLRDGENVIAVQLHAESPERSFATLRFEVVGTVTPASYLRAELGKLETAIAGLGDLLPDSLVAELAPELRFAFAADVPADSPLASRAEAWLRRAHVQRAVGRVDSALRALERTVELARAGTSPASAALAESAQRELEDLRPAIERSSE